MQNRCTVIIDLNGFKKPNKIGVDVFAFAFTPNGVLAHHWDDSEAYNITKDRNTIINGPSYNSYQCNKRSRGFWCAELIMQDGWTIKSDYPW